MLPVDVSSSEQYKKMNSKPKNLYLGCVRVNSLIKHL